MLMSGCGGTQKSEDGVVHHGDRNGAREGGRGAGACVAPAVLWLLGASEQRSLEFALDGSGAAGPSCWGLVPASTRPGAQGSVPLCPLTCRSFWTLGQSSNHEQSTALRCTELGTRLLG